MVRLDDDQPSAAPAFYTPVTGWGTSEWPGTDYTMWTNEGAPLGGVMKLPTGAVAVLARVHLDAGRRRTVKQAVDLGAA